MNGGKSGIKMDPLTIVILVNKRVKSLEMLLHQTKEIGRMWPIRLWIADDRATDEVKRLYSRFDPDRILGIPFPVRSSEFGEKFVEARNYVFEKLDEDPSPFVCLFDDDWVWGKGWRKHLIPCLRRLENKEVDCFYAHSLFIWDPKMETVNLRQHHTASHLSRFEPGWRVRANLCDHAPSPPPPGIRRDERLPWPNLDLGAWTEDARRRVFREARDAGKVDAWTCRFLEPPELVSLEEGYRWFEEEILGWKEKTQ